MPHLCFGIAATSQFFREIRADLSRLESAMIKTRLQRVSAGLTYLVSYFASITELRRGLPSGVFSIVNPVARIRAHFGGQNGKENRFFRIRVRLGEYDHAGQLFVIFLPTIGKRPGGGLFFIQEWNPIELEFHAARTLSRRPFL